MRNERRHRRVGVTPDWEAIESVRVSESSVSFPHREIRVDVFVIFLSPSLCFLLPHTCCSHRFRFALLLFASFPSDRVLLLLLSETASVLCEAVCRKLLRGTRTRRHRHYRTALIPGEFEERSDGSRVCA